MGVYSAYSFFQWDVFFLRHEEFCVITFVLEFCYYALGDFAIIDCFEKLPVWGTFARGVEAVAVVDKDFHSAVG